MPTNCHKRRVGWRRRRTGRHGKARGRKRETARHATGSKSIWRGTGSVSPQGLTWKQRLQSQAHSAAAAAPEAERTFAWTICTLQARRLPPSICEPLAHLTFVEDGHAAGVVRHRFPVDTTSSLHEHEQRLEHPFHPCPTRRRDRQTRLRDRRKTGTTCRGHLGLKRRRCS